jgi:hypothetical protein
VFSEEVLTQLSDIMATISRMRRLAGGTLPPDALPSLESLVSGVDQLAKHIADTEPADESLFQMLEEGKTDEIVGLDSAILEKIGNVSQMLSMMDLEGGAGVTADDLDSVCELVDDLADCFKKRSMLIAG